MSVNIGIQSQISVNKPSTATRKNSKNSDPETSFADLMAKVGQSQPQKQDDGGQKTEQSNGQDQAHNQGQSKDEKTQAQPQVDNGQNAVPVQVPVQAPVAESVQAVLEGSVQVSLGDAAQSSEQGAQEGIKSAQTEQPANGQIVDAMASQTAGKNAAGEVLNAQGKLPAQQNAAASQSALGDKAQQAGKMSQTAEGGQTNGQASMEQNVKVLQNDATLQAKTAEPNVKFTTDIQQQTDTTEPEMDIRTLSGWQEAPAKTSGEVVKIKVAEPYHGVNDGFAKSLSDSITKRLPAGTQSYDIQLEPGHLGKITIHIAYSKEGASVELSCSNLKTLELLTENAKNIGNIVGNNTGTPVTIQVHQEENPYGDQQDGAQQQSSDGGEESGRQGQKKSQQEETSDFIHQLRLGLFDGLEDVQESAVI